MNGTFPVFLHPREDVLHHHDGIIHDQARHQYHPQKGQEVDGKTRDVHHEEGSDQRDRDSHDRDQRSAPIPEEEEDHQDHEPECDEDRVLDLIDGLSNALCSVEPDPELEVVGEVGADPVHPFVDLIDHLDVIGPGLGLDGDPDHRHPVIPSQESSLVPWCQAGFSNILEPDVHILPLLHDHVIEFLLRVQSSKDSDGHFRIVAFDPSRRELHVLFLDRLLHISRGEVIGGHLPRVQLEAHRIHLLPPEVDAADSFDGL